MSQGQRSSRLRENIVLVLDTSAFLAKYPLQQYIYSLYTTPSVLDEVRDKESKYAMEIAVAIDRVRVVEPPNKYRSWAYEKAREIGEHTSLSKTDLDVLALAMYLTSRGYHVIVFTDDYALQNTLYNLNISFKPLRTMGIRVKHKYIVVCPVCGYIASNSGEKVCPLCGSPLVKKKLS